MQQIGQMYEAVQGENVSSDKQIDIIGELCDLELPGSILQDHGDFVSPPGDRTSLAFVGDRSCASSLRMAGGSEYSQRA